MSLRGTGVFKKYQIATANANPETIISGKSVLHALNIFNAGSSWVLHIYDAGSVTQITTANEVFRYSTATGAGPFILDIIMNNGIVIRHEGTTGNAVISYDPDT